MLDMPILKLSAGVCLLAAIALPQARVASPDAQIVLAS
jgi:hypothetical protein